VPLFAKPILLSLAAALGLYGLGVLFANMYLQSRGVQGRIREAVTRATGLPVTIDRTYYTPWSGLAISGVAVPPAHPAMEAPLVSIESVRVSLSFPALFQGRVHIKDIVLHNPRVVSRQQNNGSWTVNQTPKIIGEPLATESPAPHHHEPSAPAHSSTPPRTTQKPNLVIDAFHIRNGTAVFYMADASTGLELSGVSLESFIDDNGVAHGSFLAKTAIIGDVIKPTDLNGTFTWNENQLTLPNINAAWGGGLVAAAFELSSSSTPSFSTNVSAENVSLASLATDAGFNPEGTDGRLSGTFTLTGTPGIVSTYTGAARIHCLEARMLPIDPIRQLGDMFQIQELQVLELDTAEANATIAGGGIRVENITLATDNVILDAKGDVAFEGTLALDARFHVSERLRKKTAGILGKKFTASETKGFSHMPFSVTGTIHHPKTDLLDKIVGARLQRDLGGLLKGILKLPSNKKKSSQPLASPKPGN
jgi:hypothetical protein